MLNLNISKLSLERKMEQWSSSTPFLEVPADKDLWLKMLITLLKTQINVHKYLLNHAYLHLKKAFFWV